MLHVALCYDAKYELGAAVALASVASHNPSVPITAWVMRVDGTVLSPADLRHVLNRDRESVDILELHAPRQHSDLPRSLTPGSTRITTAMYLRLYVPRALEAAGVSQVLYLDSDLFVVGDLDTSLVFPPDGFAITAVGDAFTRRVIDGGGVPGWMDLGLDPSRRYFNSGVLGIDVANWNAAEVEQRSIEYIERFRAVARYPDQDALNAVCSETWSPLSHFHNNQMSWRASGIEAERCATKVVHPTGPHKLWSGNCDTFQGFQSSYMDLLESVLDGVRSVCGDKPAEALLRNLPSSSR